MTRSSTLEAAALSFIRSERLLQPGDVVLCAVSGGADSMALLWFLHRQQRTLDIGLQVAHVHHGIVEARSDEAEAAVRSLADSLGLRYRLLRADVPGLMRRRHLSIESAGRLVRYRWFRRLVAQSERYRIATAHTADDQAETVLMRLLRGSGLPGVCGIRPYLNLTGSATRCEVIRPFLEVRRTQTRSYQIQHSLPVVEDPTNQDTAMRRNRVRHELLPLLEQRFNPSAVSALCRFAHRAQDDTAHLDSEAKLAFERLSSRDEDGTMRLDLAVASLPSALSSRVWHLALRHMASPASRGEHIERLQKLARSPAGHRSPLPGGGEALREYDCIKLSGTPRQTDAAPPFTPTPLPWNGTVSFPGFVAHTTVTVGPPAPPPPHPGRETWQALLDADLLRKAGTLLLRSRHPGDRWVPPGKSKPRKLKISLNAWRIAPRVRERIPLLVAGDDIVCLVGYAVDERFRVTEATRQVLQLEWCPASPTAPS